MFLITKIPISLFTIAKKLLMNAVKHGMELYFMNMTMKKVQK